MAFRCPRAARRPLPTTAPAMTPAVEDRREPARAPRKLKHPERHEQQSIRGLLTSIGGRVWVLGTTRRKGDYAGTMQSPGLPDLICFVPRKGGMKQTGPASYTWSNDQSHELLVVECKSATGRLRPDQVQFRDYCQKSNIAHVVGGVDAVIAWLIERGYIDKHAVPHYRLPKNLQERAGC